MKRFTYLFFKLIFLSSYFFYYSCESIKVIDENYGMLTFSLKTEIDTETKAIIRSVPDSNSFVLSVKNSGGTVIYNGSYGNKPKEFSIPAGTYDIEINSSVFNTPAYDTPLYSDSKTVVIESGKVSAISLLCKQVNSGLRLKFSNNFLHRFEGYIPEIADFKGKMSYPFTENRFLYLNPGIVKLYMCNTRIESDTLNLVTKSLALNSMLTINLDVISDENSAVIPGITIDTTSFWENIEFIYGSEREGDGSSRENAFLISQISGKIGLVGVWVTGYIVGGDLTSNSVKFLPPFTSETNIALASLSNTTDRTHCISVALPQGQIRSNLNLVLNPLNLKKKVWIKGNIVSSYFGLNGLNPVTDYELE